MIDANDKQTLNFEIFQIVVLFLPVVLLLSLITNGKSHWLKGVLLMMNYLLIALAAWYVNHLICVDGRVVDGVGANT